MYERRLHHIGRSIVGLFPDIGVGIEGPGETVERGAGKGNRYLHGVYVVVVKLSQYSITTRTTW